MLHRDRRRVASLAAVAIVVAVQVIRPGELRPRQVNPDRTIHATLRVPARVDSLLRTACYDCHSDETRWPWYAQVAPVSWWLADDVRRGTREMNYSRWVDSTAGARRPWQNLGASCYDVRTSLMPPRMYLALHPGAKLQAADITALCDWFNSTRDSIKKAEGIP